MSRFAKPFVVGLGAAAAVVVALVVVEARRPAASQSSPLDPLTDLAAPAPPPQVHAAEAPWARVASSAAGPRTAAPIVRVRPQRMPDPAHPPRWNPSIAVPPPPVPPDPSKLPPMAVDPRRDAPHP